MRKIDTALRALVNSGDYISHTGIHLSLKGGTQLYYATDDVLVGVTQYLSNLRETGVVRHSRRRVIDAVEFESQNIDRQLGLTFTQTASALDGARCKFQRLYIGGDGQTYTRNLMQGVLMTAVISELIVECKLIGDMSVGGAIAAWRSLPVHCVWKLGDPLTCGANTAVTGNICTKRLTGAQSCETHGRRFRFSGFPFIDEEKREDDDRDINDLIETNDEIEDFRRRSRYSQFLNPWVHSLRS